MLTLIFRLELFLLFSKRDVYLNMSPGLGLVTVQTPVEPTEKAAHCRSELVALTTDPDKLQAIFEALKMQSCVKSINDYFKQVQGNPSMSLQLSMNSQEHVINKVKDPQCLDSQTQPPENRCLIYLNYCH